MTDTDLITADAAYYEAQNKVVDLFVKNINPTQIAKQLGMRRVDVLKYIDDFKQSTVGMDIMRARVEELLSSFDQHYSILIRKGWEVLNEIDSISSPSSQMLSQKNAAVRTIADLEKQRIDVLQKAGLLDAADIGDDLAQMEEQVELIMKILQEELCDSCKGKVQHRMAEYTGERLR